MYRRITNAQPIVPCRRGRIERPEHRLRSVRSWRLNLARSRAA
jgi:hypothetical protein